LKVAALYDVHGMPWALEAVLADVANEGVDAVVFGGDLVAGPFPAETWKLASAVSNAQFVRGNAERDPQPEVTAKLGPGLVAEMRSWPASVELDSVLYCHAAPASDLDVITDVTSDERLTELLASTAAPLVVGGHTHMQQRRGRYVNAGSVGMPYEGDVAAFWLVVDDGEPSFMRTPFDVEHAIALLEHADWPAAAEFAADNLRRGVSRDEAIAVFGG
jgi:predicted phosphodiesterase